MSKPPPPYDAWRPWTAKEAGKLNIRVKGNPSPEEYAALLASAPVRQVPKSYLLQARRESTYRPYTQAELDDLYGHARSLLKAMRAGKGLPYVYGWVEDGKFEILDGWTRCALAQALGAPIRAICMSHEIVDEWNRLHRQPAPSTRRRPR